MRVIALRKWNDLKEDVTREEGDIFEVDPERYSEIMSKRTDLVQVYEEEAEKDRDKAKKPVAKTSRKPRAKSAK